MAKSLFTENWYQSQQLKFSTQKWFRWWWQGWSNYGILLLIPLYSPLVWKWEIRMLLVIGMSLVFSRFVLVPIIEVIWPKERPYQRYHLHTKFSKLFSWSTGRANSFPSSHTASLTTLAWGLWWFEPGLGMLGILLALVVGSARVMLGYHYPSDIIAGFIIGSASGLLFRIFF